MKCLEEGQFDIIGNYNTDKANNIMIVFEKCNSEALGRACKTDDEINDWLRFKYIVALENERFFVQDKFDEERIKGVSHLSWYSVTPLNQRSDYVRMINLSDVVLNDDIYDVANQNEETEMAFTFGDSALRSMQYLNDFHNSVTYELSSN